MNIYLTDDDEDDRLFFKDALSDIPLKSNVVEFENGVDLMAELLKSTVVPDVFFLDLNMPLMNGYECLHDIRGEEKFSKIPIVIYSTSFNQREIDRLKKDGADRYIQKPTSFNQLKTLLYKCLRSLDKSENLDVENSNSDFVVLV
jgi:CheY-like chemotaxis protein